jgi:chromosome segregation ATPase
MAKMELHVAGIKISTLSTERDSLTNDKESLVVQLSTATEQLDAALSKILTLSTECVSKDDQLTDVKKELHAALSKVSTLTTERDTSISRLNNENESFLQQLIVAEGKVSETKQ